MITDEQLDALLRRQDFQSTPDAAFISSSYDALVPRVRAARARDASLLGRFGRVLGAPPIRLSAAGMTSPVPPWMITLLVLSLLIGLLIALSLGRPMVLGNGVLLASVKGQLEAIDPASGSARPILPASERAERVSRSPDGRSVAYWTVSGGRARLFAVDVDGRDRRELAQGLSFTSNQSVDSWSPASTRLATEVTLDGLSRILSVDLATGTASPLTPRRVDAHNPLWSPDGSWLVFSRDTTSGHTLTIVRADGSGTRDVAGLSGIDVNGPDTWSPDGQWIYFGGSDEVGQHAYRVNVRSGDLEQLTRDDLIVPAVASSPDGTRIVFNVQAVYGFDAWIATSDGSAAHLLLESGGIGSWSTDGGLILLRWRPVDQRFGGLATIRPDGGDLTVLVPFDPSCRQGWDETCLRGYGWGPPQP